jgi:hypothetical protein
LQKRAQVSEIMGLVNIVNIIDNGCGVLLQAWRSRNIALDLSCDFGLAGKAWGRNRFSFVGVPDGI